MFGQFCLFHLSFRTKTNSVTDKRWVSSRNCNKIYSLAFRSLEKTTREKRIWKAVGWKASECTRSCLLKNEGLPHGQTKGSKLNCIVSITVITAISGY